MTHALINILSQISVVGNLIISIIRKAIIICTAIFISRGKSMLHVLLWIVAIIIILIVTCFGYHRHKLKKEEKLRKPLGQLIDINANNMSIYVEGSGLKTLVFLSGSGTCSPILDFKSLYSLLSDEYRIVVVEKFGYGYSNVVDEDRNIQTILSETRLALEKAGIDGPYVLCPHSMSGIEALYWAQEYPDEIEAIIGLDMAVPEYYEKMKINLPLMKLGQYAADLGITRLIPALAESDAIKHGTLTDDEKNRYRAIFYSRTATVTMINEAKSVKANARIVAQNGVPQVDMLLFISNGTGGTGFDKETWRRIPEEYISKVESGKYIELDCPHYVHDYEYGRISEEIKSFLSH